jgi:hypothetical protein
VVVEPDLAVGRRRHRKLAVTVHNGRRAPGEFERSTHRIASHLSCLDVETNRELIEIRC